MRLLCISVLALFVSLKGICQNTSGKPPDPMKEYNEIMKVANQSGANIDVDTYDGFPSFDKNYLLLEFTLPAEQYANKEKREQLFRRAKDFAPLASAYGKPDIRIIIRKKGSNWKAKERFFAVKELLEIKP